MGACDERSLAKFQYQSMEGIRNILGGLGTAMSWGNRIPHPVAQGIGKAGYVATAIGGAAGYAAEHFRNKYDSLEGQCYQDQGWKPPTYQLGSLGGGGGGGGGGGYTSVNMVRFYEPGSVTDDGAGGVIIEAGKWTVAYVPLVFDLNGDGVSYRSSANPVVFDADGDVRSDSLAFVGAGDGMLVFDYNQNGIGETAEWVLTSFVSDAASDLEALRAFDSNGDGQFSAADAEFSKFRMGIDANQNGLFEIGELHTLASAGISSVYLNSGVVSHGGAQIMAGVNLAHSGQFLRTNGQLGTFHDVALLGTGYSYKAYEDTSAVVINQGAANLLIWKSGSGLTVDIASFAYAGYTNIIDVATGAGADAIYGDARNNFLSGGGGADILIGGAGEDTIVADMLDFSYGLVRGGAGTDILILDGAAGATLSASTLEVEAIVGDVGNDIFTGAGTSGVLFAGGEGYDRLTGSASADVLQGDRGLDQLFGDLGNDLYIFAYGDGDDLVVDSGGSDTALFEFDSSQIVNCRADGSDIIMSFSDGSDIRFRDQRLSGGGVDSFVFEDRTMTKAYVNQLTFYDWGGGGVYGARPPVEDTPLFA